MPRRFDAFLREMDTRYPSSATVFDYFVDPKARNWVAWETKLPSAFKPATDTPFFKILVPTIDTVRSKFLMNGLVASKKHALMIGNVGVGKTMIVQSILDNLPDSMSHMVINFSAQASSNSLQVCCEVL